MNRLFLRIITISFISIINYSLLANSSSSTDSTVNEETKASSMLSAIIETNNFISSFNELTTITLPCGIASGKTREKDKYAIIIEKIEEEDGAAFFTAYMVCTIPGFDTKLTFKGENFPMSFSGGITGEAMLSLVNDVDIKLSDDVTLRILGKNKTLVRFDCDGYKNMAFSAELLFNSETFVLENEDGTIKNEQMKVEINTQIADLENFIITINLPPFQLKSLSGVGFKISSASLDLSSVDNPANMIFNDSYNEYFNDIDIRTWSGVYIKNFQVRMPPQFDNSTFATNTTEDETDDSDTTTQEQKTRRSSFYGNNIIIDELGFSSVLGIKTLLTLGEGDMDGWAFSVEDLSIRIEMSELISGTFSGQIHPSSFEEGDNLGYTATIGLNGTYSFTVSTLDSLTLDAFSANLTLTENSSLTINIEDSKFLPSLNLYGVLSFNASSNKEEKGSAKLTIADIPFEGMKIQTIEPYFSVDKISFGISTNKFSKFPISLNYVGVKLDNHQVGIQFGLTLNFSSEGDGGFGGDGMFTIWSNISKDKWQYDRLAIDKISIDIEKEGAFELKGSVEFLKGDSIYGKGFRGQLDAKFATFEMQAVVIFGTVNNFRYWFADALLETSAGIVCGPIAIHGFGGGAYYHMQQSGVNTSQGSDFGRSLSGIVYVPTLDIKLGIKASVIFALSSEQSTFNGDVTFGIDFTASGGLNQIYFKGNGYFATEQFAASSSAVQSNADATTSDKPIPLNEKNAQIWAKVSMIFDYPNKSFHSDFEIFVNIAEGLVTGVGDNYRAGWGSIHFDQTDWYIWLGTPSDPNGISILNIAELTNYFMAGKSIPDLPSPPDHVIECLSQNGEPYQAANTTDLGNGGGFMFGAAINIDTGEKTFLLFYGRFGLGIGFDILLKKYGSDAICANTNEQVGIHGWYAQGQAWAWIKAEVGIKVDLIFVSGQFTILDLEVAALLQAKLPNPFWMKGNIAGNYNILNGLVKGNCDFEFEIGEQCVLKAAPPISTEKIIASVRPVNESNDADVYTIPQVVFNLPIDSVFTLHNDQTDTDIAYKLKLETFSFKTKSGIDVKGQIKWNSTKDVIAFYPKEILNGKDNYQIKVKIGAYEKDANKWKAVKLNNGQIYTEEEIIDFKTGKEPDSLSQSVIAYSYPGFRQLNYFKNEGSQNYITLTTGHSNLFATGSEWNIFGRVTSLNDKTETTFPIHYVSDLNEIQFYIPRNINPNNIYKFEIIKKPVSNQTAIDANVVNTYTNTLSPDSGNNTAEVKNTTTTGELKELKEKTLYTYYFRTSSFSRPENKFAKMALSKECLTSSVYYNIDEIYQYYNLESLEEVDIIGSDKYFSISPNVAGTKWYADNILPIISFDESFRQLYPVPSFTISESAMRFGQFFRYGTLQVNQALVSAYPSETETQYMFYNLALEVDNYMFKLKNLCANIKTTDKNHNAMIKKVLTYSPVKITSGSYPYKVLYNLPGKNKSIEKGSYNINLRM